MNKVIGVSFENTNRVYHFLLTEEVSEIMEYVIVETEKGLQLAKVVTEILDINDIKMIAPLKEISRIATKNDISTYENNKNDAEKTLIEARKIANELKLEMSFINANYTLDKKKLLFNFIADERVDFRELAKRIASIYKTRIELRQVGIRDKSKEIGGIGPCGRVLCCTSFLNDFNSVSINMAKNQNLSLNPTKINGLCGRLLCCLNYENKTYTDLKKNLPKIGSKIKVNKVEGKVVNINIFNNKVLLETEDRKLVEVDYKNESN